MAELKTHQTPADIAICLNCPLPDCKPQSSRCPQLLASTTEADRAKEKARRKKYYLKHKVQRLTYMKKWREKNKEKIAEYARKWKAENREKANAYRRTCRRKKAREAALQATTG